ncbi:Histone transcription regulator 3 [Orbilia oligospora]|uniref:Histone transcription regulator 3 homolog n=1 Tax=Orbilia oligospora TaxID=2813651 RepID=A0A7C8U9N0_ORBOL|nr:Histone transcription regulator 3 [Orbilia oligospora]
MASWTALNILEDSEDEEVADNTQEIQIEEALKLHQKALKLHSEKEWKLAGETFEELFRSEIFQQDQTEDALRLRNILYLAYRGYAEFKLDLMKARVNEYSDEEADKIIAQALEWFGEALARDADDGSLWRKTAKLAKRLKSSRLTRFALEAVVSRGLDSVLSQSTPSNPEELYATFLLRDTLKETSDDVGLQSKTFKKVGNKSLNPKYQVYLEVYPWLKPSSQITISIDHEGQYDVLTVSKKNWTAVGVAILDRLQDEDAVADRSVVIQLEGEPLELEIPAPTPIAEIAVKLSPDGDVPMVDDQEIERPIAARRRSTSTNAKRKGSAVPVDAEGSTRASKRVRNRESNAAAAAAAVITEITPRESVVLEDRLFKTANELFAELGISLGPSSLLKPDLKKEDDEDNGFSVCDMFIKDFKSTLVEWDDEKGNVALYGEGIKKPDEEILSLQSFTQAAPSATQSRRPSLPADDGLRRWIQKSNSQRLQIPELCVSFVRALLSAGNGGKAKYSAYSWSETLKDVVRTLSESRNEDFERYFQQLRDDLGEGNASEDFINGEVEVAQSLFELSLDNLSSSERDRNSTELSTNEASPLKLKAVRWGTLVGDLMRFRARDEESNIYLDSLTLRYLWANAVLVPFTNPSRDFLLECYDDLKETLTRLGNPTIELPNSASMPEISVARADREISKAKTMDFFANIFSSAVQSTDPFEVIEDLEIILEPKVEEYDIDEDGIKNIQEMTKVLETSSVQVKVSLWQKLRDAYNRLGDYANVLRCRITCINIIVKELMNSAYSEKSVENRTFILLRAIFWLNETLPGMAEQLIGDPRKLLNLSPELQNMAYTIIPQILRLLHVYVFFEDAVVSGEITKPTLHSYRMLTTAMNKLLVHCWSMMYLMYRGKVETPSEDDSTQIWQEKCVRLASAIHSEIGIRNLCKLHSRVFLKIALKDILDFEVQGSEPDLVQCLKCVYNFDVALDLYDVADHKCDPLKLDRDTALKVFPFVMTLAEKKKSAQVGLKGAMKEAMQTLVDVIGTPSDRDKDVAYNTKMLDEYIGSPMNPLPFYASLRGGSTPNFVSIRSDYAKVAEKGFFFEYGMSLFLRYKFAKKAQNQDVDDVEDVVKYLRYNLVCGNFQRWEPWYRLGQSYEFQFEDDITYGAEKINAKRDELAVLERKILHCYAMAIGLISEEEDESEEDAANKCQLYIDFAMQVYSAIRPPLEREAFLVDGYERYCSGAEGVFMQRIHGDVSLENALKFAITLFKRAIKEGSTDWKNYYMIAKCYGKLEAEPQVILSYLSDAVSQIPIRDRGEQVLEPYYKLVASVYKYAKSGEIAIQEAYEQLNANPWLQKNLKDLAQDPVSFTTFARGIHDLLNKIRNLDKQKWHHRMTYRMARIMYDDIEDHDKAHKEISTFFSHKNQLYTIWKPENERPGRHYVYVHQYLLFWTQILGEINDKSTLEALVKKLKKAGSTGGCWKQPEVWDKVVLTYAKTLRQVNEIGENMETTVYENVTYDEFNTYSQKMEEHYEKPENQKGKMFEILKDTYDLKKLNTGQTKTAIIDDLLTDTFSLLYQEVVPDLIAKLSGSTNTASPKLGANTNPMSLHNLVDGGDSSVAQVNNSVVLAAAHGKIDDYLGRKMTKVLRKDVLQKVNSMFRIIWNAQNTQNAAKLIMAGKDTTKEVSPKEDLSREGDIEMKDSPMREKYPEDPASPNSEDADDEGADNSDANITM